MHFFNADVKIFKKKIENKMLPTKTKIALKSSYRLGSFQYCQPAQISNSVP